MICESCKEREATVHLTQVVDGAIKKLHLCEECASKSGFDIHGPISITDILLGMGGTKEPAADVPERSCPRCHMRRTDFKKTGRFGCAMCYEAFSDDLPSLLRAMHRSGQHVGKVPASQSAGIQMEAELATLQQALERAIAGERFEEAARLRDEIQKNRSQLADTQKKRKQRS